jgi:polar amino acid transport system substrate-binding protein
VRLRPDADAKLKYRYSSSGYGQVTFVLYSRKAARLRPQDIVQASRKPAGAFPYKIESALLDWGFAAIQFTDMASAFRKLEAGHIDAFLWAQEEADAELRRLGYQDIVREAFGTYDDVLAIPRGPRGDFVDQVVTQALATLRASGRLQEIYRTIHLPYDPWQP